MSLIISKLVVIKQLNLHSTYAQLICNIRKYSKHMQASSW